MLNNIPTILFVFLFILLLRFWIYSISKAIFLLLYILDTLNRKNMTWKIFFIQIILVYLFYAHSLTSSSYFIGIPSPLKPRSYLWWPVFFWRLNPSFRPHENGMSHFMRNRGTYSDWTHITIYNCIRPSIDQPQLKEEHKKLMLDEYQHHFPSISKITKYLLLHSRLQKCTELQSSVPNPDKRVRSTRLTL